MAADGIFGGRAMGGDDGLTRRQLIGRGAAMLAVGTAAGAGMVGCSASKSSSDDQAPSPPDSSTGHDAVSVPHGPQPGGATYIPFGDSYIYRSGTQSYRDGATRGADGPALWLEMLMEGRLRPLANAGISGQVTEQMLARIHSDVIARAPHICLLLTPGINDVKGGVPPGQQQYHLAEMFDRLHAAGILCLTSTIPPSNRMDTSAKRRNLFTMNTWLREQATRRSGLTVVDVYPLVANPSKVAWRRGYSAPNDQTHPDALGSFTIGTALAHALNKVVPSTGSQISRSNADPGELLPNTMMLGNHAGMATATLLNGTAGASKVRRTDGIPGDWQRWTQTSGSSTIMQAATSRFRPGERVVGRVELLVEKPFAPTSNFVAVECRGAGNATLASVAVNLGAPGDMPVFGRVIVELNALVVPPGTTSIHVYHRLVGPGTVLIGGMSLRKAGT